MPAGRAKYNFYALTNGRETGVYTTWPQAGDAVLGYANAKYKGFGTYSEAADSMDCSGFSDSLVFDGKNTFNRSDYEQARSKHEELSEFNKTAYCADNEISNEDDLQTSEEGIISESTTQGGTAHTVYIDGSCIRNGSASAQAGIGLFWGDKHPFNCSISLTADSSLTNNKAELRAAIKAVEIANENDLKDLIIISDSRYVVNGITEWVQKWMENGWKTASGDHVKNKEEWLELMNSIESRNINIRWQHISAHSGIAGNEEADKLALSAAKRETTESQTQVPVKEKTTSSNTQPQVIVIPRKEIDSNNLAQKLTVINIPTTPARKLQRDVSETPVPGAVNGSSISGQEKVADRQKISQYSSKHDSCDSIQTTRIMKNMESVLETVMFEIHQLKQHQIDLKSHIHEQFNNIYTKQQNMQNFMLTMSNNMSSSMDRCINKIKDLEDTKGKEKPFDTTNHNVSQDIASLQKRVNNCHENIKNSIQTVESTVSAVKEVVEKMSMNCQTGLNVLETKNNQLQEGLTEVTCDIKSTKQVITEMEKSLTVLTKNEDFVKPAKTANSRGTAKERGNAVSTNMYAGLFVEEEEVSFTLKEPSNQNSIVISDDETQEQPQTNEEVEGQTLMESSQDIDSSKTSGNQHAGKNQGNKIQDNCNAAKGNTEIEKHTIHNIKRDKVYLIGDSIAGQVNSAVLGKATKTFVSKLKAPKIQDINKLTNQVKDAKLIIVHAGINNIRENDSTEDRVSALVNAISSLKEAAPDSEVVVSKPIPVGDRALNIERNIFNAKVEKRMSEDKTIHFLDHGNLAEQAQPIQAYFRDDLIHLAPEGVEVLTTNIRRMILKLLKRESNIQTHYQNNSARINRETTGYRYRTRFIEDRRAPEGRYNRRRYKQYGYSGYRRHYEDQSHHNTYSRNYDGYTDIDNGREKDKYTCDDMRSSRENTDDRDNDRYDYRMKDNTNRRNYNYDVRKYTNDNNYYNSGDAYGVSEMRYRDNRQYDTFQRDYQYKRH